MIYKMSYEMYMNLWLRAYADGNIPSYEVPMTKEQYEKGKREND